MNERLNLAEAIFHEILNAPPEERAGILLRRCAGDAELRTLVQRLIAHDENGMGSFLVPPERAPVDPPPPARIGPYGILKRLGGGGMGTVYLARQTEPVQREVAVKVVRAGLDSKEIIVRFEAERQALALMDHPNIARVLDAGTTDDGYPYFVMELIHGVAITEYCDRNAFTVDERLELFRRVCEAVQHAHQKGIIHRDLKPSNVLVTDVNGRPVPKVIDFGVAKALGGTLTARTLYTQRGVLMGTPEYMSPEQAELDNPDVDTRADVYSLGVILYELLVGDRPFEGGSTLSLLQRIREEEPERPSSRLASSWDPEGLERSHRTAITTLRRQLRGDLDWIVMRALEKDRNRRYASAADLDADIGRYLGDEAVTARPPSTTYRIHKFVRRHRVGVVAATLVILGLALGVIGASLGLVRARRAEARARGEQERAEKASAFLASTLREIDPAAMAYSLAATLRAGKRPSPGATTRATSPDGKDPIFEGLNLIDVVRSLIDDEVLDKATKRIDAELSGQPELAADLYRAIAPGYSKAQSQLDCSRREVDLSRRARGPDDPTTIRAVMNVAGCYKGMGEYPKAEELYREAYESSRRILGDDARLTIAALASLGGTYQQWGQAWQTLHDRNRRPARTAWLEKGLPLLQEAWQRSRREFGPDDPLSLGISNSLGLALRDDGQYAQAESLLDDTIQRYVRVRGATAGETLNTRMSLASVLYYSGRIDEAVSMALDVMNSCRRSLGADDFIVLVIEDKLAGVYLDAGRPEDAEPWLRDVSAKLPRVLGEQNQYTQDARQQMDRLEQMKRHRASH